MSEVLTQFDVDPARQREMHAAIHEEAKRLARMIDDYLNITRLEAGARALRKVPVRVDAIVERVALLLNPIGANRGFRSCASSKKGYQSLKPIRICWLKRSPMSWAMLLSTVHAPQR